MHPRNDTLRLQLVQEILRDMLTNLIQENKKLKEQKKELFNLNSILSAQINRLKKNSDNSNLISQNMQDQMKFIEMQEQIFSGRSNDPENDFAEDILSLRVKYN